MIKIFGLWLFFTTLVFANEYEDIAKKFLLYEHAGKKIISSEVLKKDTKSVAYLFNLSDGGYIVVPMFKSVSPIKAFSFKNDFKKLPLPYKDFLLNELYNQQSKRRVSTPDESISKRWKFLDEYKAGLSSFSDSYTPDSFLLTSKWNQSYPYNKFFPKVNDSYTLAGCVQIAMGQLMHYHKHPSKAKGIYGYRASIYDASSKVREENLRVVLNRDYNWDNMPDSFGSSTKAYQEDEVAYLLRDLVVVNEAAAIGVKSIYIPFESLLTKALFSSY